MMKKNEEKKGKKETGKKVMSVKAKLLMILIPCIALAMALLILVFYMLVAKQMKRTSEDMLESSVRSQENQIESWMNEKLAAFQMIKTDIEKEPRTDEELQKLLDLYVGYESDYPDGIYLADSKGNLMTGEDSGKTDKNPLESVWYKQGLTRINMAFGSCYENSDGTNVISASGILNDGSDNIRVLSADVSLDRVSIIVNSNVDMSGAVSFLVDLTDNTILAHRDSKIVSTSLSGQSDAFLKAVAEKVSSGDYETSMIEGKMTSFQEVNGTNWLLVSYVPESVIMKNINGIRIQMFFLGIFFVLIMMVVIFAVVSLMINPVKNMTKNIVAMSDGDFTIEVKANAHGEIGIMSQRLSQFVQNMREMILNLDAVARKLKGQADASTSISADMSGFSETQLQSMTDMNLTVDQLSESVNEISQSATTLAGVASEAKEYSDSVSETMNKTVSISEEGREKAKNVGTVIEEIRDSVNELGEAVDKVGNSAMEITNIVHLIGEISDETNLLSLNASIEAARAGEAGKGFSVVASEIGKLAQTSADAVNDIVALVSEVQSLVGDAVTKAKTSVDSINESAEYVSSVTEMFDKIYDNVKQTDDLIQQMTAKIGEVDEVATNVAAISEEQAASSMEIMASSEAMVEQARQLSNCSQEIAEDAEKLAETSDTLSAQIGRFKVEKKGEDPYAEKKN